MTASILRQAGCVSIDGRGVLIEGPPGSGKTSLALMLIDRGARLVGDDGVMLTLRGGHIWAWPPPNTFGKLEIRNVGILDLPPVDAPLSLRLVLSLDGPRYVERAEHVDLGIGRIPSLLFDASGAAAAIRAEYALGLHGMVIGPDQAPDTRQDRPFL